MIARSVLLSRKAQFLDLLANANRLNALEILCRGEELSVSELAAEVGLSQSALSQHLAKLRASGLVAYRRVAQTVYYSINAEDVRLILELLSEIFDGVARPPFRLAS